MFIFRWIRNLLALIGVITVVWFGMKYFDTTSPLRQRIDAFTKSEGVTESIKDMKTFGGAVYKEVTGGKGPGKATGEVTDDERKKLDELLEKEINNYKTGSEKKAQSEKTNK